MKKIIFLIPILVLCLTGCNGKNEEAGIVTCALSTNDIVNGYKLESTYKLNYSGKYAISTETEEVVISDSKEVLDYFEKTLNDTYSKLNEAYGGYTYKITKKDDKITSIVKIDYSKMNMEKFVNDQPAYKSFTNDNKLLAEGVKSIYENLGATCE